MQEYGRGWGEAGEKEREGQRRDGIKGKRDAWGEKASLRAQKRREAVEWEGKGRG